MKWKLWAGGLSLGLALFTNAAQADEPLGHPKSWLSAPPGCISPMPGISVTPQPLDPNAPQVNPQFIPQIDSAPLAPQAFAEAPAAGTGAPGSFNPVMFGDQLGALPVCDRLVAIRRSTGTQFPVNVGSTFIVQEGDQYVLASGRIIPISSFQAIQPGQSTTITNTELPGCTAYAAGIARGGFKIAENNSPRPLDRIYLGYNYYHNVYGGLIPNAPDVHRETIGFEKTFFDGDASFGMRLPFVQITGDGSIGENDIGNLTMFFKYAFLNDLDTGNILSAGLAVTVPTGSSFLPAGFPDINPTILQPYVGGICNFGDFYVHGFSSIAIPTDDDDVTSWFNDIGIGWFAYRAQEPDTLLTAIVPTVELHITTPLNHRGSDGGGAIPGIDIVNLTAGVTFGIGENSAINLGVVTPLTGPKPFDVEGLVYFNFRF